uniref:Uncharacterized protein n=1 Tax=Chromera velia CCMP2878 TaxID=1169474 RepID=A0A0G4H9V7_9ALVE|eukprot:Cvel_6024.t1-p1 / transcript=Cvel_6024.t1 / gene=Cvel_6024 / organism=Chromera_velia_CCMP2878 / gene_product=hypothetical protein / transcript_product=hypothetical protein / location=Cvel_scaffold289:97-19320(-) / protein_length=126 / sequence_SO=supercontig / SO=protein_coding / is_pseudo=false
MSACVLCDTYWGSMLFKARTIRPSTPGNRAASLTAFTRSNTDSSLILVLALLTVVFSHDFDSFEVTVLGAPGSTSRCWWPETWEHLQVLGTSCAAFSGFSLLLIYMFQEEKRQREQMRMWAGSRRK